MAIKKLIIRGIILLILSINAYPSLSQLPSCSENSEGAITYMDGGSCVLTADTYTNTFYFIGLCQTQPTVQNFRTACSPLFQSNEGKTIALTKDTQVDLIDEVSVKEGIYPYAAILMSKTQYFSISKKFSPARTGKTGTGEWCWTLEGNSVDWNFSSIDKNTWVADCGPTPPTTVGQSFYSPNAFHNSGTGFQPTFSGSTAETSYSAHILLSDETLTSGNSGNYFSFPEATYALGLQTFNTPVTISPNTSNINVGFLMTNAHDVLASAGGNVLRFTPEYWAFKVLSTN